MKLLQHLFTVNDESEVVPVIPYEEEDDLIHTEEHPECDDPTCFCHDTQEENE